MKIVLAALTAFALAAPLALAQDMPPGHPGKAGDWKAEHARHHGEMCTNLYAHAVGKLAELDVQLKLTSVQKPLFERWKNVKLAAVKAHSAKCATMTPPDGEVSLVEHHKMKIAMLEAHLADMKAEQPALEALIGSLDKDQQEVLKRAGREAAMMRMHFGERMMEHHGRMGVHGPMDEHGPMDRPDHGAAD
ncbi:MAG: Spy/CpxP family protein refolding chaperone [Rhizomicrobium sp.]|nr:Spy/CpxP family protein refolding chaperone [Rhizomicrobium sp.]